MNQKKQIFFALCLVLIISLAVWLSRPVQEKKEMITVVAAAQTISSGQVFSVNDFMLLSLPAETVIADYLQDSATVVGKVALFDISEGEIIHRRHIAQSPKGIAYDFQKKGTRLMTIQLSADQANGFWLAAGNKVDVDLIAKHPEQEPKLISLENITVASVLRQDHIAAGDNKAYYGNQPLVCLALTREQVKIISAEMNTRDLRLSVICTQ